MGIMYDGPPSVASAYMLILLMLTIGFFDFMKPEAHYGAYILTFVGAVMLFMYFVTYKEKPYMKTWKIIEADGTEHFEDLEMPGGETIKTLAIGLGLIIISMITYFIPWLRFTSFIFLGFGGYAACVWIWVFYEINFKKEASV